MKAARKEGKDTKDNLLGNLISQLISQHIQRKLCFLTVTRCRQPQYGALATSLQILSRQPQQSFAMPEKVALVGSGNWGSAIATKIGVNVLANDMFDKGARRPY